MNVHRVFRNMRNAGAQLLLLGMVFVGLAGAAPRGGNDFDPSRYDPTVEGYFQEFNVEETMLLQEALQAGVAVPGTWVMVTETASGPLALLTEQMAFHHIAQGTADGVGWMATFCVVCNTGVSMAPTVDGAIHRFYPAGLYDGLFVMRDRETGTLWNHVTGQAMDGPLRGEQLAVSNLLQMNAAQALEMDPLTRIAISDRPYSEQIIRWTTYQTEMNSLFQSTLGEEDTRLDRMDLGLGIWGDDWQRYYPLSTIHDAGYALIDKVDGRRLLVYIDPHTATPAAVFIDAKKVERTWSEVRLDDGSTIKHGVVRNAEGEVISAERPYQLFTRWYGFALTFPDPDIYRH